MSYLYVPHTTKFDDKHAPKLEDLEFLAKKNILNYTSSYRFRKHLSLRKAYPMNPTFQSLDFKKKVNCMKYLMEPLTLPLLMEFKLVDQPVGSRIKVEVYCQDDKLSPKVPVNKVKLIAKMTMSKTNYFKSAVDSKGASLVRVINKPITDEHGKATISGIPREGDLEIILTATAAGYDPVTIPLKRIKGNWRVVYNIPSNRIIPQRELESRTKRFEFLSSLKRSS